MPPVSLSYTPSHPQVLNDDAMQHNGTAALHPAAHEKLLGGCGPRKAWKTLLQNKSNLPCELPTLHGQDHSSYITAKKSPREWLLLEWLTAKNVQLFSWVLSSIADQGDPKTPAWASPVTTCTHHSRFGSRSSSWASPAPDEIQKFSQKPKRQPPDQTYTTPWQGGCNVLTLYVYFSGWRNKLLNFLPLNYILSTTQESSFGSQTPNRLDQHWPLVISRTRGSEAPAVNSLEMQLVCTSVVKHDNKEETKIRKINIFLRQTFAFSPPAKKEKKSSPKLNQ